MPHVVEDIPPQLQPAAEAALAWINQERGTQFKLTGLYDALHPAGTTVHASRSDASQVARIF
jgi:hypothetical protein